MRTFIGRGIRKPESKDLSQTQGLNLTCYDWTKRERRKYHEQMIGVMKGLILQCGKTDDQVEAETIELQHAEEVSQSGKAKVRAFVTTIIEPAFKAISSGKPARIVDYPGGRWVEYTLQPHKNGNGEVDKLAIYAKDITDPNFLVEALQRFEERYRLLLKRAQLGIGISDLEGKVLLANPMMLEMTGLTLEELKLAGVETNYVDPKERKRIIKILQRFGKVRDYKVRLKRKDGEIYSAILNIDQIQLCGQNLLFTTALDLDREKVK